MASCSQILLLVFNLMFLLAGLGIFTVGILVHFTKSAYHVMLDTSMIPIAVYMMIASGSMVMMMSLAGCCGALTKNRSILGVYISFLVLVFLVEVAVGIIGFLYAEKVEQLLDEHLKGGILNKYGMAGNGVITKAIDVIQQEFECCGYAGSGDWAQSKYYSSNDVPIMNERGTAALPKSCCVQMNVENCNDQITGPTIFNKGCKGTMLAMVKLDVLLVGGVAVAVAVIQLSTVVFAVVLFKRSKTEDAGF